MDINDLIALYNPANAGSLTADQIEAMRTLTDEQIDALAKAYPNTPGGGQYLLLWDNAVKPEKQFYQMSSWQNLRNLRKFNGAKNFVAYTFKSRFTPAAKTPKEAASGIRKQPTGTGKVVVDLTAKEAADDLRKTLEEKRQAAEAMNTDQGDGQKKTKVPPKKKGGGVMQVPPPSLAAAKTETPADQLEDDPTGEEPAE